MCDPRVEELNERFLYAFDSDTDVGAKGDECLERMRKMVLKAHKKWGSLRTNTCYLCIPNYSVMAIAFSIAWLRKQYFEGMEVMDDIDQGKLTFMGLPVRVGKVWAVAHD